MKTLRFERSVLRFWHVLMIVSLLCVSAGSVSRVQAAPSGCSVIYNGGNGWVIDRCTSDTNPDPSAPALVPMTVFLNGTSKGSAVVVRIYHKSQNDPGTPQVAVIYSSGYIRLKQNDDPSPAIPFGTSFILGPAYYDNSDHYHHNPQLNRLEIDTTWLPDSPLRMKARGTNQAFNVIYDMALPSPRDRQTRMHVIQTYTATANVNVPQIRLNEKRGFKLVQASSMYINNGAPCDGGYTDCHDSDDIRFIANDLNRRQRGFNVGTPPFFIMSAPRPLGSTWLDVLHKDDQGWQSQTGAGTSGNTPNVRVVLDAPIPSITPQGYISQTTDPTDDNVNMWLHDDRPASATWNVGKRGTLGYWLLAQDNPPDPWADLGLRPGETFLNFNGTPNCRLIKKAGTTGKVGPGNGYVDRVMRLHYNLGSTNGNWAQIRCDFSPPLDLSAFDHLRFEWLGHPTAANSLEVGLINLSGNIFARGYHHVTHHNWWGQMVIPFKFLQAWTPGTRFDPTQVSAFFVSVVKDPVADVGGAGVLAIDNLGAINVRLRNVPSSFETVDPNPVAAEAAANWLASQQQPTGLLRSWEKDPVCWAYTYDQALALIVFSQEGMWRQANPLVNRLTKVQNADGSWNQNRDCNTLAIPADSRKWEGDIAWAIYALRRYLDLGGTHPGAEPAILKGANWLATRVNARTGCLVINHTEATIDAWWAFQAAGPNHVTNANKIKNCLLTRYWDNNMGRFKGGLAWWQPYLDNQTWGAAFLKANGENLKARRALSYARAVLRLPAQGGQLFGFDGQGGPWSVWNEGTAQYIAVGGSGSRDLLQELLAQQRRDGAMPSSPDDFSGGGVWTTRWHGVAPTAWLYNALSNEPFHPSMTSTDISLEAERQETYTVTPGEKISFPALNHGPLKLTNPNNKLMFGAEQILYKINDVDVSFSQMMTLPDNQLDTTYWLPWYNNVDMDTQLRFANVSDSEATVHVYIGGQEGRGSPFTLAPGTSIRKSFPGIDQGPIEIQSNVKIVASERVIYRAAGGVNTSFSETMALPESQLDTVYWLPWYNNKHLKTQLRLANVSDTAATVHVTIGGREMPGSPFTVAPAASLRKSFPEIDRGPVKIESNVKIVASERVIYGIDGVNTSFSEMLALPNGQLDTVYWLPWHNSVDMDTQLRFANVSGSDATVYVYVGGLELDGSPFTIGSGASIRKSFPGIDNGPVKIVSDQTIVVAERVIYPFNSVNTSFSELMAMPNKLLDSIYWLPWYNNVDIDTQLRFGTPQ